MMPDNNSNTGVFSDRDVIDANRKLLDALASGDDETYSEPTAADLTAMEPASCGNPVRGRAFRKYSFDLYSHLAMATEAARPAFPAVISTSHPHVRWLGGGCGSDGCGEGTAAVITYVRLDPTMTAGDVADGRGPAIKTTSETRVWEGRDVDRRPLSRVVMHGQVVQDRQRKKLGRSPGQQ